LQLAHVAVVLVDMHLKLGALASEVEGVAFLVSAANAKALQNPVKLAEYTACSAVSRKLILFSGRPVPVHTTECFAGCSVVGVSGGAVGATSLVVVHVVSTTLGCEGREVDIVPTATLNSDMR
jgi:hypothetical protein